MQINYGNWCGVSGNFDRNIKYDMLPIMNKDEVKNLIREAVEHDLHKNEIKKVSLFGSCLYGTSKKDSDIDILIEFKPSASVGFFKLARMYRHFREHLGRDVDLVTPGALSKYFRDEVIRSAETVYEG